MKIFSIRLFLFLTCTLAHAQTLTLPLERAYAQLGQNPTQSARDLGFELTTDQAKHAMDWIANRALLVLKSGAPEASKLQKIDALGKMATIIALTAVEPSVELEDDRVKQERANWIKRTRAPILAGTAGIYSLVYWLAAAPHLESVAAKALTYLVVALPVAVAGLATAGAVIAGSQENFYTELEFKMRAERAREVLEALAKNLKNKTDAYLGTSQELRALLAFRANITRSLNCSAVLGG